MALEEAAVLARVAMAQKREGLCMQKLWDPHGQRLPIIQLPIPEI